ncbi:MAG TPA: hypothetical protein VGM06_10090 [Polyangiaceae bacterium]|jgi:hypothetical protein
MTPPQPVALRLWTRAPAAPRLRPPCGLSAFSDAATAIAVLVDATGVDEEDAGAFADQIPAAIELEPGTPVFVLDTALRGRGALRWLGARKVTLARAARCTALVARGYVGVGAIADPAGSGDLVWGFSSPC